MTPITAPAGRPALVYARLDAGRLGAVQCIFRVVPRNAAAGERCFFAGR